MYTDETMYADRRAVRQWIYEQGYNSVTHPDLADYLYTVVKVARLTSKIAALGLLTLPTHTYVPIARDYLNQLAIN